MTRETCYFSQKNVDSECNGKRVVKPVFQLLNLSCPTNNLKKPSTTFSQREKCMPFWQTRCDIVFEGRKSGLVFG